MVVVEFDDTEEPTILDVSSLRTCLALLKMNLET